MQCSTRIAWKSKNKCAVGKSGHKQQPTDKVLRQIEELHEAYAERDRQVA